MKMLHIATKYVPYFALQKSQFYMCHGDTQAQVCSTGKTGRPVPSAFRVLGTALYSPRYAIRYRKATPGNVLPVVVVRHVTSYRTSGRGCTQSYIALCIIFQGFISSCALIPGSLSVAPATRALKYPTSQ